MQDLDSIIMGYPEDWSVLLHEAFDDAKAKLRL